MGKTNGIPSPKARRSQLRLLPTYELPPTGAQAQPLGWRPFCPSRQRHRHLGWLKMKLGNAPGALKKITKLVDSMVEVASRRFFLLRLRYRLRFCVGAAEGSGG